MSGHSVIALPRQISPKVIGLSHSHAAKGIGEEIALVYCVFGVEGHNEPVSREKGLYGSDRGGVGYGARGIPAPGTYRERSHNIGTLQL
jgi:hypothetical protein